MAPWMPSVTMASLPTKMQERIGKETSHGAWLGYWCLNFPWFVARSNHRMPPKTDHFLQCQKSWNLQLCRSEVLAVLSIDASLLAFPEAANIQHQGAAQTELPPSCRVASISLGKSCRALRISGDTAIICYLNVSLSLYIHTLVSCGSSPNDMNNNLKINCYLKYIIISILCQSKYDGLEMKGAGLLRVRVRS